MADTFDIQAFEKLKADVSTFVEPAMHVAVGSDGDLMIATASAKQVKALQKAIEAKRVELTAPLLAEKKRIDDYAKSIAMPLDKAESHLKKEMIVWDAKLAAVRKAERERIEAEQRAARQKLEDERISAQLFGTPNPSEDHEEAAFAAHVQAEQELKAVDNNRVKGVSRVWVFDVEDADLLPRRYLIQNDIMIRNDVKAGVREIPGVRIYEESRMSVRA